MITQKQLKEILIYDENTGVFFWNKDIGNKIKNGTKAGSLHKKSGYVKICINGKIYKRSILAWLYCTGKYPLYMIDHKNRIRNDDRFCNLREADNSKNKHNQEKNKNNVSGFKGVCLDKRTGKFKSEIMFNHKRYNLGTYNTPEEAALAYNIKSFELCPEFSLPNKVYYTKKMYDTVFSKITSVLNRTYLSKYRGVSFKKNIGKYHAYIRKGKLIHLGYFDNEYEAAEAYDKKAKEIFGEFANLNFNS